MRDTRNSQASTGSPPNPCRGINPERTLPWGLFLGTGSVGILYLLANFAYLASLPVKGSRETAEIMERVVELHPEAAPHLRPDIALVRGIDQARDQRVATAVLERVSPHLGVPLMAIAIMISTFGCNNGLILMGPPLHYSLGHNALVLRALL